MIISKDRPAIGSDVRRELCIFRRHRHLARAGDTQRRIYRLESGWACSYALLGDGRRQITAIFVPGDYCEPDWLLNHRSSNAVIALTQVRASAYPLYASVEAPGSTDAELLAALLDSLNRKSEWIVALGRKTAIERVSYLLWSLFDRLQAADQVRNDRCAMPLTQGDLADSVGLTPVHVNRVLRTLRHSGLVELEDRTLHLPDPEALRELGGGTSRRNHNPVAGSLA